MRTTFATLMITISLTIASLHAQAEFITSSTLSQNAKTPCEKVGSLKIPITSQIRDLQLKADGTFTLIQRGYQNNCSDLKLIVKATGKYRIETNKNFNDRIYRTFESIEYIAPKGHLSTEWYSHLSWTGDARVTTEFAAEFNHAEIEVRPSLAPARQISETFWSDDSSLDIGGVIYSYY